MAEVKIYIANLGKYNEGELVGKWVTLPVDEDELNDVFVDIKLGYYDEGGYYVHGYEEGDSYYEEFAIHDYEAPFKIEEYTPISKLNELAEMIENMDEEEIKIASAVADNDYYTSMFDALKKVNNGDVRIWHETSMADIAYEFYEETGMIDDNNPLISYVDWERVGRDMEIDGTFIEVEYGLWVELYN